MNNELHKKGLIDKKSEMFTMGECLKEACRRLSQNKSDDRPVSIIK